MRVAYVCSDPGIPIYGSKGASVHVQEILRAFVRRGDSPTVFAQRIGGPPPPELEGVPVIPLPAKTHRDCASRAKVDTELCVEIAARAPFDLVYQRHALFSYGALEYARTHGIAGVLEVNAPLVEEQARFRRLQGRAAAEVAEARAYRAARRVIAVSARVAETIAERAPGTVASVVANGVDAGRFSPEAPRRFEAPAGAIVVGFHGSLKTWHGVERLIDAIALARHESPGLCGLIVGHGPVAGVARDRVRRSGLSNRIHFTGAVPPDEMPGWLSSMDIACAPYTRDADYFSPLKVWEAMASGRAVVASRFGQLEERLTHAYDSWLVPPGDTAALAAALVTLARDPALRRRLGAAARASVCAGHTWDRVLARSLGEAP